MRARLVVTGAALLLASPTYAQSPEPHCERAPGAGRGAVQGVVQDSATGLPLQSLTVTLLWEDEGRRRTQQQQTDLSGAFSFCDVPAGVRLQLEAESGGRAARMMEVAAGASARVELVLAARRSAVSGRVLDHAAGRGIADVEVRLRDSEVRAVSNPDGSFQLPDIPAGVYWLDVRHLAFLPRSDSVRVHGGGRTMLTVRLSETAIQLRPIEVNVRIFALERAGFYDRQDKGFGTFVQRRDWQTRAPHRPTDVLRTSAGVRIVPRRDGPGSVPMDRSNCPFRYVVDGVKVGATFQMDDIPVEWLEAIEVYRGASTIPAQFAFPTTQPRSNCGVIVIWTRRTR